MAIQILTGDCRRLLSELAPDSLHCAITSPPYLGLRTYGTHPQVWGGDDPRCPHEWGTTPYYREGGSSAGSHEAFTAGGLGNAARLKATRWRETTTCRHCGAWLGELGGEPTVELYVAHLVEVFQAVRRVLRPDGTCWINLGDSYTSGSRQKNAVDPKLPERARAARVGTPPGLKEKDLIGVPWRVALALQADGWWLRSEIIWQKPNCVPESMTDRPTRSHETVFLLTKSARYFYDQDAIREPPAARPRRSGKNALRGQAALRPRGQGGRDVPASHPLGRNRRTVWTIPTQSFRGAHFATFPTALVTPMILAGCPPSGTVLDPFCGAGTTLLAAQQLGRAAIGLELSPAYAQLATERLGLA